MRVKQEQIKELKELVEIKYNKWDKKSSYDLFRSIESALPKQLKNNWKELEKTMYDEVYIIEMWRR